MTFWTTKAFQSMQRAWYQKLQNLGFCDAEKMVDGEMVLTQNAHHSVPYEDESQRHAREEYYRTLRDMAQMNAFDSEVDKVIMTMIAEGARQKEIELALNTMGIRRPPRFMSDKRRCRESIRLCVRKYERRWGLREAG